MAITQSEAIVYLGYCMGRADGEWTQQEQDTWKTNPVYKKHIKAVDANLLVLKIKRGEATKEDAISTLKARTLNTQLDALAIVYHMLIKDGLMHEGEKKLMGELLGELDIELNPVKSRLNKILKTVGLSLQ